MKHSSNKAVRPQLLCFVWATTVMLSSGRRCAAWMVPRYHPAVAPTAAAAAVSHDHYLKRFRGGASNGDSIGNTFRSSSSSSTTVLQSSTSSTLDNAERTEVLQLAKSALGDNTAAWDFGGLKYYNTAGDNRFRCLFILGGPGSGKGTQSELMEEHYPMTAHFSVGELLRHVPDDSPHKAVIDEKLVAGQIVPVEISLALLKAAMQGTTSKGPQALFLVDGFPRNFDNLAGWCRVMQGVAVLQAVLVYQCPLAVLQQRVLDRGQGRSDDNLESVKKRFATFEQQTVPVIDTLREVAASGARWNVVDIAGDKSLDDVWVSTQQVLNELILDDVLTANAALLKAVQGNDLEAYRALVDDEFFAQEDLDPAQVMRQQEGGKLGEAIDVQLAQLDVISGKEVAVSYNRQLDGVWLREKRFWTYQGVSGWRNVHFQRTPVPPR